jgi:regulator of sigma E protease
MGFVGAIVVLGLVVLVHELGHFLAARWSGVPVARFSVGFGPALWSRQSGRTEFRLAAVPLGGYVLLGLDDETSYLALPLRQRLLFCLGGPAANLGLALLLFAVFNTITQGLTWTGLLLQPFAQTFQALTTLASALAGLFSGAGRLSGLVGIVADGGRFVGSDPFKALSFSLMMSLNLAFFNLLPLPPLDGGKILLDLLHRLRPGLSRLYLPATLGGWLLVAGLMLYATALDITRLLA